MNWQPKDVKPWQINWSIKLSTAFLVMSLLTVSVVGYVAWAKTKSDLERLAFNQLNISATLKEGELNRWFDDQRQFFTLLNQSSEFQAYLKTLFLRNPSEAEYRVAYRVISQYLDKVATTQPNLKEIFILKSSSRIIVSTNKSREGTFENLSNFTLLAENSLLVPGFYPSPMTGQPTSTYAVSITDATGKVIGLIATDISLERIDNIIRERTGLGSTGETYLVGEMAARNTFISGGRSAQDFSEDIYSHGIEQATQGKSGFGLYQNYEGIPVIGVYRWLEKRNLALLAEMHQNEAFAPANQLALGIIIVGLGATGMLIFGVYLLRILEEKASQLEQALGELRQTQAQLIHTEKMSGLGQMVAGVAHEINNPINFIHGNLMPAHQYAQDLLKLLELYQQEYPYPSAEIETLAEEIEIEFITQDLLKILSSMKVGTERIRQIVISLRNFSRHDESDMKEVDIHEGIDSTLMILQHRLKAYPGSPEIQVTKEYGQLPKVECYAGQLNQVFMNILTNALDALEESHKQSFDENYQEVHKITISTQFLKEKSLVRIKIKENGPGMPSEVKPRIFDHFFTTKPVGKGTGLGLSICYKIIVEKHGGTLNCISELGKGTEFLIDLPISQSKKQ